MTEYRRCSEQRQGQIGVNPPTHFSTTNPLIVQHSLQLLSDVPAPLSGLGTTFLSLLCFTNELSCSLSQCVLNFFSMTTSWTPYKDQAEASSLLETSIVDVSPHGLVTIDWSLDSHCHTCQCHHHVITVASPAQIKEVTPWVSGDWEGATGFITLLHL
jgi:hypothetical protein